MDDNLFANILNNSQHVLRKLLPDKNDHRLRITYNLRPRRHRPPGASGALLYDGELPAVATSTISGQDLLVRYIRQL